ncbi:MAG: helix-turn-helix transcriptional regulator [Opitutaceae bacterium]|nr:helix-turn-helix transcriptional regulator [Opitutaceae bacterium]
MPRVIDLTVKTRLLLRPVRSALGTILIGGVNQGGVGVGRPPAAPRAIPCYSMLYVTKGRGVYSDDHTPEREVGQGDLILYFPGRPHRCGTRPGEFWDELWFQFEGPVFDLMGGAKLLDPARPVHHRPNCDHWFRRFFELLPPLHLRGKIPPAVTVSRFAAVLTEILSGHEAADEPPAPRDDWLSSACEFMVAHGKSGARPAAVARKLGLSYETFRKKFRGAIGFAPGRYHHDSRIDRAAALLHQSRHTIKEIAAQLEFCDEFYFSRCFKRRFGQSPRDFRARVRGQ